jgi:cell division protein FtsZ
VKGKHHKKHAYHNHQTGAPQADVSEHVLMLEVKDFIGGFEVKNKKRSEKPESNIVTQREIEFDITGELFTVEDKADDKQKSKENRKATDRVKTLKRNYEQMREMNLSNRQRQSNIEELENQPAYVRKNIKLDSNKKPSEEKKISKFSLEDDQKNGGVKLSDNNPYLHENVD